MDQAQHSKDDADFTPLLRTLAEEGAALDRAEWIELADTAAGAGHLSAASELARATLVALHQADDVPVSEVFAAAICAHANATDWRAALELLYEFERADVAGGVDAYTEAMRACRSAGEWARAMSLLHRARARSVRVTTGMYAAAIGACDDAGETEQAMALYTLGVQDKVFTHWVRCSHQPPSCCACADLDACPRMGCMFMRGMHVQCMGCMPNEWDACPMPGMHIPRWRQLSDVRRLRRAVLSPRAAASRECAARRRALFHRPPSLLAAVCRVRGALRAAARAG